MSQEKITDANDPYIYIEISVPKTYIDFVNNFILIQLVKATNNNKSRKTVSQRAKIG